MESEHSTVYTGICKLTKSTLAGMVDTFISWEDTQDPQGCHWGPDHYQEHSRDPARTPMQWDESKFAGM